MIYLDNAATSKYKPSAVVRAVSEELRNGANPGRSAHGDSIRSAMKIMDARDTVRTLINNPQSEVIFTKNCTEALNLAIFGTVKEGGHVITTVNEHNSVLRPLHELERRGKIRLTILPVSSDGSVDIDGIDTAISRDTYLVCVNHISNVTGAKADIEAIAALTERKGLLLLVDAAQSIGHTVIDTKKTKIDLLAAAGHKGLHGPQGTGFLAFDARTKIKPLLYGGTGTDSESVYQPFAAPEAYESGTVNTPSIAGLKEGIVWTLKNKEALSANIRRNTFALICGLKEIKNVTLYTPPEALNGVVSFNIKGLTSSSVGDILNEKYNIAVRTGLHCAPLIHRHLGTLKNGTVRASLGYNNSIGDIKKLIDAVKETAYR